MNSHNHAPQHSAAEADSAAFTPRAAASAAATGGGGGVGHVIQQPNHHSHHPPPPPPPALWHPDDPSAPLVRLMCSYGGRILPRPHDNQLRYVGGETRIVAVPRSSSFSALLSRLSKILPPSSAGSPPPCLKYQLPNEDLDALVSLTSDEDVENMFDEYDRLAHPGNRAPRLRLFLFPHSSAAFGSVVDAPGSSRDQWFLDALNGRGSGPPSIDRGRSEASSMISEVPDYLFGLENAFDEPSSAKPRAHSASEPGSPFSASSQRSVQPIPDLPPVKTKLEAEAGRANTVDPVVQLQSAFVPNSAWSYTPVPEPAPPVFYVQPTPIHGGSQSVQHVPVPVQYIRAIGSIGGGPVPAWFQQPFPGVPIAPVQGGPVYAANQLFGPGTGLGSGHPHTVGAETYEAPAGMFMPVYHGVGVPSARGEEAAAPVGSELHVGKPAN